MPLNSSFCPPSRRPAQVASHCCYDYYTNGGAASAVPLKSISHGLSIVKDESDYGLCLQNELQIPQIGAGSDSSFFSVFMLCHSPLQPQGTTFGFLNKSRPLTSVPLQVLVLLPGTAAFPRPTHLLAQSVAQSIFFLPLKLK